MNQRLQRLLVGKNRGLLVINVFRKYFSDFSGRSILDVGCGHGSLTLDFSRHFKTVHSIDSDEKPVQETARRVRQEKRKNVTVARDNALNIRSTKKHFDVIHLSGVFEWLRAGDVTASARVCQDRFLKNIHRQMKPDAILYSGTENRLFPYFWVRDAHHRRWPFMVLFPAWLTDALSRLFGQGLYLPRIHSFWALKRMFRKHFEVVDFYVPIPHYQFVYAFAPINDRKAILRVCNSVSSDKLDVRHKVSLWWIRFVAFFGLAKWFVPCFLTVARRPLKGTA